uniref:Uncharacterized protein n=1 Tax=Salix viminalis TaxID=40686 RepID=A0A6N2K747_SALVM
MFDPPTTTTPATSKVRWWVRNLIERIFEQAWHQFMKWKSIIHKVLADAQHNSNSKLCIDFLLHFASWFRLVYCKPVRSTLLFESYAEH